MAESLCERVWLRRRPRPPLVPGACRHITQQERSQDAAGHFAGPGVCFQEGSCVYLDTLRWVFGFVISLLAPRSTPSFSPAPADWWDSLQMMLVSAGC